MKEYTIADFLNKNAAADNVSFHMPGHKGRSTLYDEAGYGQFLKNGFGFVAMESSNICAVAFSSAVSDKEVDIGVETYEEYRKNGLAAALAQSMCEEITKSGRKPVWAHAEGNIGSGCTALKCGFREERRATTCQIDLS